MIRYKATNTTMFALLLMVLLLFCCWFLTRNTQSIDSPKIRCIDPSYRCTFHVWFYAFICHFTIFSLRFTVKPVQNGRSKIDKTKVLMTTGCLMKVESIAECSLWSILQYFWPALSDNRSWKPFLVFLTVAVLHRFYCFDMQGRVKCKRFLQYHIRQAAVGNELIYILKNGWKTVSDWTNMLITVYWP